MSYKPLVVGILCLALNACEKQPNNVEQPQHVAATGKNYNKSQVEDAPVLETQSHAAADVATDVDGDGRIVTLERYQTLHTRKLKNCENLVEKSIYYDTVFRIDSPDGTARMIFYLDSDKFVGALHENRDDRIYREMNDECPSFRDWETTYRTLRSWMQIDKEITGK